MFAVLLFLFHTPLYHFMSIESKVYHVFAICVKKGQIPLFLLQFISSLGCACNTISKPVVNFIFILSSYSSISSDYFFFPEDFLL